MTLSPPKELPSSSKSTQPSKISARKSRNNPDRLCQGDILENVEVIENITISKDKITLQKVSFPYIVILNQECDLERDFDSAQEKPTNLRLLHIAIAPAFLFESFLSGKHWGDIFTTTKAQKRGDTTVKKIIDNEIPRYHYLNFGEPAIPELIIDFKHFFTINRSTIYEQKSNRIACIDDLFREKINQRFSYYISRIGLPTEGRE